MSQLLDTTREKLRKLAGASYIFPDGKTRRLISFEMETNGDVTLNTDLGPISKQLSEIPFLLERLKTPGNLPALPTIDALVQATAQVDSMLPLGEIAGMLMESMKKLQTNPEYVNQAREINAAATTIVNIAKVRVDALRTVQSFQKNNK